MCGFAGLLHHDGQAASSDVAERMAAAVAHRGPDGRGVWAEGPVALAHRRLAILDLGERGAQPQVTGDGRHVLVYNGELYNFRELRGELEELGRQFRGSGDTEVVLQSLAVWGAAALPRFDGMFALALWDRTSQRLLLARDRYGVKPLYWMEAGGSLLFGSEIKALFRHPAASGSVDPVGLLEYLNFQNFLSERTLFGGVRLLAPGCSMEVQPGRTPPARPRRYWDFAFVEPEREEPETDSLEELDRLFRRAVRRQMVSDVPVACYLSGGMDSGAIAVVAARHTGHLRTFTCGFDLTTASGIELSFDERAAAERLSYLLGTEQYEVVLKAGDMQRVMPELAWHIEEPRVGQSYPNYSVARLASRFDKVVLAGTGSDELFGGYPWRYYRSRRPRSFAEYVERYYGCWQRLVPESVLPRLLAPVWSQVRHVSPRELFAAVFPDHDLRVERVHDYVNRALYFEAKTFLHGLLVVEDKLSMAHGLETRVPFLDNDLVDFAQRLPLRLKLRHLEEPMHVDENLAGDKPGSYYQRTRDGKLLLRELLRRYVPEEVADRTKQGFSAPDASWFRGESIDFLKRTLSDSGSPLWSYLGQDCVAELVDDHLQGRADRRLFIWAMLSLDQALRLFLGSAPTPAAG